MYEWRNGAQHLITDGVTSFPLGFVAPQVRALSADGGNILFTVDDPGLTGFEQDGFANLYDARVGGGFTPPSPPAHCSEESCQGPLQAAPALDQSSSSIYSGPGNESGAPKPRCRKGKVRRHGRCVKAHHKRRHHKRAAHAKQGRVK